MDNLKDLIVELYKLNPDGIFMIDDLTGDHNTLFSSIPIEDLKLPEGFYYNEKNGITNKHNTEDGHYVSFKVNAITREELEKMEVENKYSKEDIEKEKYLNELNRKF